MFPLFQSIFSSSSNDTEAYPEWLVEKAIERAVDGIDPRLRALSGYKKKLRPSVIHAIEHVMKMVDNLPPAIAADRSNFNKNPVLSAFFVTANEMQDFFSNQRVLLDYMDGLAGSIPEQVVGLLMMDRIEKQVFGIDMVGDIMQRDVAQVTVSFEAHRLLDPADQEAETMRFLKRRAFDHLIQLALQNVISIRKERDDLERQRILLRRKLKTLQAGSWGFDGAESGTEPDHASMQKELEEIEGQLQVLPTSTEMLRTGLDSLISVFNEAQQQLWSSPVSIIIDRMHIKREKVSDQTKELRLLEFHSANGMTRTGQLVSYPVKELLPRRDLYKEARRYLS